MHKCINNWNPLLSELLLAVYTQTLIHFHAATHADAEQNQGVVARRGISVAPCPAVRESPPSGIWQGDRQSLRAVVSVVGGELGRVAHEDTPFNC